MSHIKRIIINIANEEIVKRGVDKAFEEADAAYHRYISYLPSACDLEECKNNDYSNPDDASGSKDYDENFEMLMPAHKKGDVLMGRYKLQRKLGEGYEQMSFGFN